MRLGSTFSLVAEPTFTPGLRERPPFILLQVIDDVAGQSR